MPIYTFKELIADNENITVTDIATYNVAYNVATKQLNLAIAHFNEN